ncbi:MAG: hypothetical protein OEZ39_00655 [Gammaproteobacteria bacterium]|nr:hypothetical protein [Gammaproteobacteria bacterium]MDH5650359.1 hypothetical protein [Gammaproteobacteria bacterium]
MRIGILFALLLTATTVSAGQPVPVIVGGDENMDACPSLARPNALPADQLTVHAGPSASQPVIDTLKMGADIWVCRGEAGWIGVVYPDKPNQDCGIHSPIEKETAYPGPCKSGWVRETALEIVAG